MGGFGQGTYLRDAIRKEVKSAFSAKTELIQPSNEYKNIRFPIPIHRSVFLKAKLGRQPGWDNDIRRRMSTIQEVSFLDSETC